MERGSIFEGRYRIEGELGKGGFGTVYKAFQVGMDRMVALKVLNADVGQQAARTARERFLREVKIISKLRHPNTVTIHDFGETGSGVVYMVLEYVDGQTLKSRLQYERTLEEARACQIGLQVAKSLSEAHHMGIIHRDLKPANIMLTQMGADPDFVKVLDFGVARLRNTRDPDLTSAGLPPGERELIGTPRYMSPEQVRGEELTGASDVYSLGLMLYECLVGYPAVKGDTTMALITQQVSPEPLRLEGLESANKSLVRVIRTATSKKLAQRYRTAEQLIQDLEAAYVDVKRREYGMSSNTSMSQDFMLGASYEHVPMGPSTTVPGGWQAQQPMPARHSTGGHAAVHPSQSGGHAQVQGHQSGGYPQVPGHRSGGYPQVGGGNLPEETAPHQTYTNPAPGFGGPGSGEFQSVHGNFDPMSQGPLGVPQGAAFLGNGVESSYDQSARSGQFHEAETHLELEPLQPPSFTNAGPQTDSTMALLQSAELPPPPADANPFAMDEPEERLELERTRTPKRQRYREKSPGLLVPLVTFAIVSVVYLASLYIVFVTLGAALEKIVGGPIRFWGTLIAALIIPIVPLVGEGGRRGKMRGLYAILIRGRRALAVGIAGSLISSMLLCFVFPVQIVYELRAHPNWFMGGSKNPSQESPEAKKNRELSLAWASIVEDSMIQVGVYDPRAAADAAAAAQIEAEEVEQDAPDESSKKGDEKTKKKKTVRVKPAAKKAPPKKRAKPVRDTTRMPKRVGPAPTRPSTKKKERDAIRDATRRKKPKQQPKKKERDDGYVDW